MQTSWDEMKGRLKYGVVFSLCLMLMSACGSGANSVGANSTDSNDPIVVPPKPETPTLLHTENGLWLRANGRPVQLKGVNLGNWLIQEFWMMGQGGKGVDDQCSLEATLDRRFSYAERERLYRVFRQNWIKERDWDMLARFNLNVVRVPFIWSVIEDEQHPGTLRADAWDYLDEAVRQARSRGMYVILDLHGAVGSQGWEQHSGCTGKNLLWTTPSYQARTLWLWQQIARHYKDNEAIAGYSLLNEPWGTSEENLASYIVSLAREVRAIDTQHVLILPGHAAGISAYKPDLLQGLQNYAFEMHFYPGFFGWGQTGISVHKDWLQCGVSGNAGVCEWSARLKQMKAAFYVGEFQPWSGMGADIGGQVTRLSYDRYAALGWAATSWSYKVLNNTGGQGAGTWGLVTNEQQSGIANLDFNTASPAEIEALFKSFGSVPYEPQQTVMNWMNSSNAPNLFSLPQ